MTSSAITAETVIRQELLRTLYVDHYGWLVKWLCKTIGCPHNAADVAQDTFCCLLRVPDLSIVRQPRAYLATTAKRLWVDDVRRQTVEQAYREAYTMMHGDSTAPSPERLFEVVETLTLIVRVLNDLPEKPRRAFLMSRVDGIGYADIAARLGVSVSMVKKYIASTIVQFDQALRTSPGR